MNEGKRDTGKGRQLAVFLSFVVPGLGQVFNGEVVKGTSFFVILQAILLIGYRISVLLPDRLLLFGPVLTALASLALAITAILDAYRNAGKGGVAHHNRWYFYLAAWLVGYVIIGSSIYDYGRTNYMEAFKIPTGSMEPAVLKGDRLLADKTAYRRIAPKKGDIVIFVYPDDRSKMFIKRVEALPGETLTLADGKTQKVPHGSISVIGDNTQNSLDSRHFGFVPLRDVVARARQVYFSSGEDGIRWGRIGMPLN
jgi:signal peptidase I